ncbi:V-type ATP synthase subunit E [Simkania negevensis]|uniref:V-type ATP synthase subunit E n=1 Tax=Simkania negevensis TaxID=83561 RepID=A0ABS3AQA4_9BACT|nr:V-type ATP synthase subunit E [Simkania negevensis]
MKTLETSEEKIGQICRQIRDETLEPAREEAAAIVAAARSEAQALVVKAEAEAEALFVVAKGKIEKEREVFTSSLCQSARQALDRLRQEIEQRLFNDELGTLLCEGWSDGEVIAKLVDAVVQSIERDGVSGDFSVVIPKAVPADKVAASLVASVAAKVSAQGGLQVASFGGGIQVKMKDKKMTLDLSDAALKELLMAYVRKSFREYFFSPSR